MQPMLTLTTRQIHFSFQTLLKNSLSHERKNFTTSAFTNHRHTFFFFPKLSLPTFALLFFGPLVHALSFSALGNAPLSSSILFSAMFQKPFCAVKRPTSNSSFRFFHSFLGKSFSFDFPPFHLSVSLEYMEPWHSLGIFICLLLLLHFMQRYLLAAHRAMFLRLSFVSTKIHFCFCFGSSYSQSCYSSSRQRKLVAHGNPRVNLLSLLLNCIGPDLSYLLYPSLPHLLQTHLLSHCHLSDNFSKGDIFLHLLLGTAYLNMFFKIGPLQCSHSQVLGQKDMCECSVQTIGSGDRRPQHFPRTATRETDMRHVSSRARSSFPRHLRFTLSVSC